MNILRTLPFAVVLCATVSVQAFGQTDLDGSLLPGSTISGTVLRDGKPVSGHVVSVCHSGSYWSGVPGRGGVYKSQVEFSNEQSIATDRNGRFEFSNLISDSMWYIYSDMDNEPDQGAFAYEEFESGQSGTTRDLGNFELHPRHSITGKIVMVDGGDVPDDFLLYSRVDFGGGSRQGKIEKDGTFKLTGLPQDQIEIRIGRQQYRFAFGRHKFQQHDEHSLVLVLETDIEDMELFVERDSDQQGTTSK